MNYQIQPGDTLSSIAAKHGTTVQALLAANPTITNANLIRAGSALAIPVTGTSSSLASFAPNATSAVTGKPVYGPNAPAFPSTGTGTTKPVAGAANPLPGAVQTGYSTSGAGNAATGTTGATGGAPTGTSTGTGTTSGGNGITVTSTGDSGLDQVLNGIKGLADGLLRTGYTIPANLQITPALISTFTQWAHQNIDPYTQQQLSSRLADVNASLQNIATTYGNDMGQLLQDFGTGLATEQNTAGANGVAFSGQRALNENNMVAGTNRNLSTLASNAATQIGSAARSAAADVGSANAGGIVLPGLAGGSVSLAGTGGANLGSNVGGFNSGPGLNYNYDPSIYTVGNIPSTATGNINTQTQNYISQYGTLANANSGGGRSMTDLLGMMSGLPSNYTPPTNLT